jgi:hypothetical protein
MVPGYQKFRDAARNAAAAVTRDPRRKMIAAGIGAVAFLLAGYFLFFAGGGDEGAGMRGGGPTVSAAPVGRDEFTDIIEALGTAVARLHAARVRQRDLKALNILVEATARGQPRVTFVDLEGMQVLRSAPSRVVRVRDLARLAVSLREARVRAAGVNGADWERVLRRYLEAGQGASPADEEIRWWIEKTLDWAERKEARNRRRGRPAI